MPGKVLRPILGKPMLWHIVQRVRAVPELADVVVATSDSPADLPIVEFCDQQGISVFAGSENDVLDRFYQAALRAQGDPLVRITGDCPLADPALIQMVVSRYGEGAFDHVGAATGAGALFLDGGRFPDGLDVECLGFSALERAWREAVDQRDREHVTSYIWRNKALFQCDLVTSDRDYSALRWTVDHEADFEFVSAVYSALYDPDKHFGMTDILSYLAAHPELAALNRDFVGHEGYLALWGGSRK